MPACTVRRFCPLATPSRCPRLRAIPREILKPPRTAAARVFTDIRRWSIMPEGGHFAALEQPELLAGEVRAFFRELR